MRLYHEAAKSGCLQVLRRMSERHCNEVDEYGRTPAHWAAHRGFVDCLRVIIGNGGDPDKQDSFGNTCLHLAAGNGHLHCVSFLIAFGANIWCLNDQFCLAIEEAARQHHLAIVQLLDQVYTNANNLDRKHAAREKEKAYRQLKRRLKQSGRYLKSTPDEHAGSIATNLGLLVNDCHASVEGGVAGDPPRSVAPDDASVGKQSTRRLLPRKHTLPSQDVFFAATSASAAPSPPLIVTSAHVHRSPHASPSIPSTSGALSQRVRTAASDSPLRPSSTSDYFSAASTSVSANGSITRIGGGVGGTGTLSSACKSVLDSFKLSNELVDAYVLNGVSAGSSDGQLSSSDGQRATVKSDGHRSGVGSEAALYRLRVRKGEQGSPLGGLQRGRSNVSNIDSVSVSACGSPQTSTKAVGAAALRSSSAHRQCLADQPSISLPASLSGTRSLRLATTSFPPSASSSTCNLLASDTLRSADIASFLGALHLQDFLPLFTDQFVDMEALQLCSEADLQDIGVPLGPRRKILHALRCRESSDE